MDEATRAAPVRTGLYLTLGSVLTVIGLIGIGLYALSPRETPAEGDPLSDAAWQSGVILGAAVATGVGVLLLLWVLLAHLRARGADDDA